MKFMHEFKTRQVLSGTMCVCVKIYYFRKYSVELHAILENYKKLREYVKDKLQKNCDIKIFYKLLTAIMPPRAWILKLPTAGGHITVGELSSSGT